MSKSSKAFASIIAPAAARNSTTAAGGGGDEDHLSRSQARALIDEEVEKRPFQTKHSYLQAKQKAPNLLQDGEEADPWLFMERCSHNVKRAADFLCLYWKERLNLFGLDRAFLPMILTGYGAMDKDDILMVKSGFPALLPNTSSGQLAIFCDRRQCTPGLSHTCRMRACFYYLNLLAQDKRSREQGVLALVLLVTPRNVSYDSSMYPVCRKFYNWALNLMPLKIAEIHLFNVPPKPRKGKQDKGSIVNEVLSGYINNITDILHNTDEDDREDTMIVHFDHGDGELAKVMRVDIRFDISAIPTSLGGTWDFIQSTKWWRKRIAWDRQQYDWLQPYAPAEEKKDSAHDKVYQSDNAKRGQDAAAPPPGLNTDGEPREIEEVKLTKKRALNAIHSRRKRERRRDEVQSLKDKKSHLTREKERLLSQQGILESLLLQAQTWIASSSPSVSTSETTGDAHIACGFAPSLPNTPVNISNGYDLGFAGGSGTMYQSDNAKRGQDAAAPPPGLNTDGEPRETEEVKLAKKRALNAIHSRRKRERCRDKVQSLKDEKSHLTQENERLLSQQGVLESLLLQAQTWIASSSPSVSTSEMNGDAYVACGFLPSLPNSPVNISNKYDLVFSDGSGTGVPNEAAIAAKHWPNFNWKNPLLDAAKSDDAVDLFCKSNLDDLSVGTDFMNSDNAGFMAEYGSPFGNDVLVDDEAHCNELLGEDVLCLNVDRTVFDSYPFPTGDVTVPTPFG